MEFKGFRRNGSIVRNALLYLRRLISIFKLTSSFLIQFLSSFFCPPRFLLFLLRLSTFVEVLDNDAHKHVEDKEADKKEKGDKVDDPPLVVILYRLDGKRRFLCI